MNSENYASGAYVVPRISAFMACHRRSRADRTYTMSLWYRLEEAIELVDCASIGQTTIIPETCVQSGITLPCITMPIDAAELSPVHVQHSAGSHALLNHQLLDSITLSVTAPLLLHTHHILRVQNAMSKAG